MTKRYVLGLAITVLFSSQILAQENNPDVFYNYKGPKGRQIIPRGFVMNTDDTKGEIVYSPKDYLRAARLGANFQVIRLNMARLGAWPGYSLDTTYLNKLDAMVALGKQQGIQTVFKMTIYRIEGPRQRNWGKLWRNENGEQDAVLEAWQQLWERYKDDSSVFGYDLINEPERGDFSVSYDELQRHYLVPLYRRLIDSLQIIDGDKWALYQPILMEKNPDRAKRAIPFYEMEIPINREKIMYSPHIYQLDLTKILLTISRYKKEAQLSDAPLYLGEWGSATYNVTDSSLDEQHRYIKAYTRTASIADSLGMGMIKAWFLGTRWKGANHNGKFTWAIFKDGIAMGTAERKYIVDVIARPFPSAIAGTIQSFNYDFASRRLAIDFTYHKEKGNSEIFVGANRHYPDGFTITIDQDWVAVYDPLEKESINVIKSNFDEGTVSIVWNEQVQKLILKRLPEDGKDYTLQLRPGTLYQLKK